MTKLTVTFFFKSFNVLKSEFIKQRAIAKYGENL